MNPRLLCSVLECIGLVIDECFWLRTSALDDDVVVNAVTS